MNELKDIIAILLKEIEEKERIVNVTGAEGYGTGTARANKYHGVSTNLGRSMSDELEDMEVPEEYVVKPVKISKAFKKENK